MMKKINHKIKSLKIELDKSIQLKELNSVIKKFEKIQMIDTKLKFLLLFLLKVAILFLIE